MELIEHLKKSLLFSGLDDTDLTALTAIAVRRTFGKGEALFAEGDEATGFYLLVEGHLKLCRVSAEGREKVLHFVRPGETFAEAAFFGDGRYPAEARALEAGEALFLPRQGFMELMTGNPRFAMNLVVSLSLSLRRFARQIEELTFADVTSRLASFLVKRAAEKSTTYGGITYLELGIKKGELAAQLGTAGETISRTFRKLKEEGILEMEARKVTILQMERLQKLAERQQ
ncbi:Crp/Fnr family transcriptional regulator [Trichlorobacter ammonificans]|uniref:Transcriptional regulator, Crp/Fnr family n=1 Tax=Trichlorobacter ammonificans TaxID=2916410 RepID=A0ABN8HL29_9BACT|nr:Crp/Fnr family transcriptional regulator [Trichlorobacter ammonificans]CAH2031764.1 Transcriptional regulator, Crp/Fnr family [Trichlorobacter ammonificans]